MISRRSRPLSASLCSPGSRSTTPWSGARGATTDAWPRHSAPGQARCTRVTPRRASPPSDGTRGRSHCPHPLLDDAYGNGTPYARIVAHGGQVALLAAPLDTATLVHHAEAVARVEGKRRAAVRCPVLVDGRREWLTIHDIDTGSGALDYGTLTAGRDYVEHFVARTLASGGVLLLRYSAPGRGT